jgi:single-stranded-DNA-specific exonuclease RecJ
MAQMQFTFEGDEPPEASAQIRREQSLDPFSGHPPTPRRLLLPKLSSDALTRVSKAFNLSPTSKLGTLVSSMVVRRGWDSPSDLNLLSAGLSALPDPYALKNFEPVVARIRDALTKHQPIAIVGDFDVDGITSLAILGRLFQSANAPHTLISPNRQLDGFGISERISDQILAGHSASGESYGLVILVDHGSQAHEQIDRLRRQGIDVVVADHHVVHGDLPNALVINPRQPGCGWHAQYPCAAALSQLIATAVAEVCQLPRPDLGLAAIGTIADMVPLTASSMCNRVIARAGLSDLRRTANPGILALAKALSIGRDQQAPERFMFTSEDIAFLIGPTLNASGRLDDANICVELLTTDNADRAREIAVALVKTNSERKKGEGALLIRSLLTLGARESLPHMLVHSDEAHHLGLNGLLAQRLAQRWGRPALVLAPKDETLLVGSGRAGTEQYDVFSLLHRANGRAQNSGSGFVRYGGHKPAGGVTLRREHLPAMERLLNETCAELYGTPLTSIDVVADCQMRLSDLKPALFAQCEALLEPFGNGFASPRLLVRRVQIEGIRPPRNPGGRFSLTLTQGAGRIDALIGSELWDPRIEHGATLDIVASPMKLYRNEERFIQLSVIGCVVTKGPRALLSVTEKTERSDAKSFSGTKELTLPSRYIPPEPRSIVELETSSLNTSGDHSGRLRRSAQPKKLTQRCNELKQAQIQFDGRYLYPHLEALEPDYFSPKPTELYAEAWRRLCDTHGLSFDYSTLELRPAALEFIEYFFQKGGSHVLQAPTNSGKTKIALMIASHFVRTGDRAVFVAPTREIAQQVYADLPSLFGPEAPRLLLMAGSPSVRRRNLACFTNGYIVATAATLRNDVKSGALVLNDRDLIVIDECHHATGKDSAVSIIEHAKDRGARRLLLSATPWQVKKDESATNVNTLLTLAGADHIFPLNRRPHPNTIAVQFCHLSPEMKVADLYLRQAMDTLREALLLETDRSIGETAEALRDRYASDTPEPLRVLSPETLDALRKPQTILALIHPLTTHDLELKELLGKLLAIRKEAKQTLTQPEGEYVSLNKVRHLTSTIVSALGYNSKQYWLSRGALELTFLHRALINEGVPSFLLRSLEKRCGLLFPKPLSPKDKKSAWGEHITDLYLKDRSPFIERAFAAVAPGDAKTLWRTAELEALFATTSREWFAMKASERSAAFRTGYAAVKRKLLRSCEDTNFFAHPADEFILHDIQRHGQKSFIWVDKIEQVKWLAEHMNRQLGGGGTAVVGLTGAGRPGQIGMTGRERDRSLGAYRDDPNTRVIIGTTALNEGIDVQGVTGYERALKGSFIQSTQKAGRPGRRDRPGEIVILCVTRQHYRTVISNIGKSIENQEMLNAFRAEVVASVGLPPAAAPLAEQTPAPRRRTRKKDQQDDNRPRLF